MRRALPLGFLALLFAGALASAQVPVYLPDSGPVSVERGRVGGRLFPRSRPLPTVDPTSRDGASLRSRTTLRYVYPGPVGTYGPIPTAFVVANPVNLGGLPSSSYYSRAYTGSSPFVSGGTYNLYGGYATPSTPEGFPTVIVPPPPTGVILVPAR